MPDVVQLPPTRSCSDRRGAFLVWFILRPKEDKMRKTGKGLVRGLTIAALGFSLVASGLAPVVAAAEEGPGVTPFAIIESVLYTFKTEQCLTTSDHDWERGFR